MDYIREYKRFINSHYLNGAKRITAGIGRLCAGYSGGIGGVFEKGAT